MKLLSVFQEKEQRISLIEETEKQFLELDNLLNFEQDDIESLLNNDFV